jgi:hypothetical protein
MRPARAPAHTSADQRYAVRMGRPGPTHPSFDNEFAARAREDEDARHLATIPGIGVLQRYGAGARHWQGAGIRTPTRPFGLARARTTDDRWQTVPEGDHKTRQRVSAHAPDPRRACCHDPALRDPHHTRQMGLRGLLARAHANTVVVAPRTSWRGSPGRYCALDVASRREKFSMSLFNQTTDRPR